MGIQVVPRIVFSALSNLAQGVLLFRREVLFMARELPKVYEPQQVEKDIYKMWEDNGYFAPNNDKSAKPFTIVMPPPNVTGQLHMGHAMDATLQIEINPIP